MSIKALLGGLLWRFEHTELGDGKVSIRLTPRLRFLPAVGPIVLDRSAPAGENTRVAMGAIDEQFRGKP